MSTHAPREHRRSVDRLPGRVGGLVGPRGVPSLAPRRGRKPRVPLTHLLPALTWHVMQDTGTLAEHLFQLFREPLADSSWSDRRLRLPWEIFADLMRRALRPRAIARQHRDAFWRGWRVVALDGTQFSLINTPQITATLPEGGDASRAGGVRQDDHRGLAGSGPAQSAGRRHRPQGRIRMGLGAAAAGAAAETRVVAGRSALWRDRLCPGGAAGLSARRQSLPAARVSDRQAAAHSAPGRWHTPGRARRACPAQSPPRRSSGSKSARFACAWAGRATAPTSCGCGPV